MPADFQAFVSHTILDSFQKKIEVVEAWGDKVIAGLSDGSLVILEPNEEDQAGPWQVVQALKQFSKKSVMQMQVRFASCHRASLGTLSIFCVKFPLPCFLLRLIYLEITHVQTILEYREG